MENGNKPAYPDARSVNNMDGNGWVKEFYTGLTKREYFAAMAMQGILSNSLLLKEMQNEYGSDVDNQISFNALETADALLKHLDNGDKNG